MDIELFKSSLLQAAFEGKLTKQLLSDSSVDELIVNIAKEKTRLIKEKKIKKSKSLASIREDEILFDIPETWRWIKIGNIGSYKKGPFGSSLTKSLFVPKGQNTIKVYEQQHAIKKDLTLGYYYITKEYFDSKMSGFEVFGGDIIVSCAGTIGESYKLPQNIEKGIINQALMIMRISSFVNEKFFIYYFDFILKRQASNSSKGSAIKNIPPFAIFKNMLFPLPPLEEQYRIVTVLEALDMVSTLEEQKKFLNAKFSKMFKSSFLLSAIKGELTEQLSSDSSVDEILSNLAKEKARLIKEKKIKKSKPLVPINENEIPFDIPKSWRWVRLGDIMNLITDGAHKTPTYKGEGIPFLSVKDLSSGLIDFSNTRFIPKEEHEILSKRCNVEKNDILLTKVGTTGIPVLVETDCEFSLFVSVALLKFVHVKLNGRYLVYCIKSPIVKSQCDKATKGVGNKNWVLRDIANTILPLPPLEEQQRIVEKLDIALTMCDNLIEK